MSDAKPNQCEEEEEWTFVSRGPCQKTQPEQQLKGQGFQYQTVRTSSKRKNKKRQQAADSTLKILPTTEHIYNIRNALEKTEWWDGLKQILTNKLNDGFVNTNFVQCLGLGSFEISKFSRHQLACALLIKDLFGAKYCCVSDPIMTDNDNQLIGDLGLEVSESRNVNDVVIEDGFGILFMPHCVKSLNIAIANRWLQRDHIDNIIYIGNTLSTYMNNNKSNNINTSDNNRFDSQLGCISKLFQSEKIQEIECPDSKLSTLEYAFNDLSVIDFGS